MGNTSTWTQATAAGCMHDQPIDIDACSIHPSTQATTADCMHGQHIDLAAADCIYGQPIDLDACCRR
jgi:uncharacterized protein (DUF952 family)